MTCIWRYSFVCLFVLCLSAPMASAQDTTTVGGIMASARKQAIEQKDYANAIRLGKKALQIVPGNPEILVFIGRTYSWAGNVDSSAAYLQQAVDADSLMEDAYIAYTDVYYWNKLNTQAFTINAQGLSRIPSSRELRIRKAKVLEAMGDYKQALLVTDTLLATDQHNAEILALNIHLKDLTFKNRYTMKFDYAHFDKQFPDDWQFYSIEYAHAAKKVTYVLRVNAANRFTKIGLQYEADAYPKISKTFYTYFNLGFSDHGQIFPRWRSGASLFANLPHAFECEAGARYLYYSADVFFYTAYIGKYYKNFLFGGRIFGTPSTIRYQGSAGIIVRYYFGGADDYVNLNLFRGISPDDRRYNLAINTTAKLESYLGEVSLRKSIKKLDIVSFNASLYRQEYLPETIGNMIQIGLGYTRRF